MGDTNASPVSVLLQRGLIVVALVSACSARASNAPAEQLFMVGVEQQFSYVDNLFRLPDDYAPSTGPRHDWLSTSTAGVAFNPEVGLQRFNLTGRYSYTHFFEHDEYSFGAPDISGLWNWSWGKRFNGKVSGSYRESAADFDGIGTSNRGQSRFQRYSATANYWFHPDWAFGASGALQQNRYTYTTRDDTGYENKVYGATVTFRPRSGNKLVASALFTDGLRPESPKQPGSIRDYEQWDYRVNGNWMIAGQTRLSGYLGYTDRTYQWDDALGFSSPTGRLSLEWWPQRELKLELSARREIGAEEDEVQQDANYSLTDALSVSADWQILQRFGVLFEAVAQKRDYKAAAEGAEEALHLLNYRRQYVDLQARYQWSRKWSLVTGVRYDVRHGESDLRDYVGSMVHLSISVHL